MSYDNGLGSPLGGPVDPATGIPASAYDFTPYVPPTGPGTGPSGLVSDLVKQRDTAPVLGEQTTYPTAAPAPTAPVSTTPVIPWNQAKPAGGLGAGVKDARQAVLAPFEQMKQAKAEEGAAEAEKLQAEAGGADEQGKAALRAEADLMHVKVQKDAYVAASQKAFDTELGEIKNAQEDPNHYYNSLSGGEKFKVSAAVALGALGEALGSGPNRALEMFNKNIDRDIQAQRSNLSNKKAGFAAKQSLYAQQLAKYGDDERAVLATKALSIEATKAQVEKMALASGSKTVQARADQAIAGLNQQQGEVRLKFAQEDQRRADAAAATSAAALSKLRLDSDQFVQTTDSQGKLVQGYAPSKEEAKIIHKKLAAHEDIANDMQAMVELAKQPGSSVPGTQAYANLKAIQGAAMRKMTVYGDQGAMSKGDADIALQSMGDPTSWDPRVGGEKTLSLVKDRFMREKDTFLGGYNIQNVRRVNAQDKYGLITPLALPTGEIYKPGTVATPAAAQDLGIKPIK